MARARRSGGDPYRRGRLRGCTASRAAAFPRIGVRGLKTARCAGRPPGTCRSWPMPDGRIPPLLHPYVPVHRQSQSSTPPENVARRAGPGAGAAAQSQDGSAPPRPAERQPASVLDLEARRELVEQASGKSSRQVMQLLVEVDPELAAPGKLRRRRRRRPRLAALPRQRSRRPARTAPLLRRRRYRLRRRRSRETKPLTARTLRQRSRRPTPLRRRRRGASAGRLRRARSRLRRRGPGLRQRRRA